MSVDSSEYKELKIVMGGRWGVGKSSIRRHIISSGSGRFKRKYLPTVGSDFSFKEMNIRNKKFRLLVWDLAGEVRFQQFRSLYFQAANAAFLVFDLTDRESVDALEGWVRDLKSHTQQQGIPIMIIGNKKDLILDDSELCISDAELHTKIKEFEELLDYNFRIPYVKTSALTGENINFSLESLIEKCESWNP